MAVSKVHGEFRLAAIAGADLSNSLFRAAKFNANKELVLCVAGDNPIGSIYETATQGRPATVGFGALVNFIAGGAIPAGSRLKVNAAGAVVVALPADASFGTAANTTATNEVVEAVLNASGATA